MASNNLPKVKLIHLHSTFSLIQAILKKVHQMTLKWPWTLQGQISLHFKTTFNLRFFSGWMGGLKMQRPLYWTGYCKQWILWTVKPVLRDHCHERPPVLTDHAFSAEGPTFQYKWTCYQRPPVLTDHIFCGQWGGLSWKVLLYMYFFLSPPPTHTHIHTSRPLSMRSMPVFTDFHLIVLTDLSSSSSNTSLCQPFHVLDNFTYDTSR